jgi:hypothetical protein
MDYAHQRPSFLPGLSDEWAVIYGKLTDADGENGETDTWLDFALNCNYLPKEDFDRLTQMNKEVGAMLGSMIKNPGPFIQKSDL